MQRWEVLKGESIRDRWEAQTRALLQQGYDAHNEQFREHIYDKQRQSDDFVDHVLDCQRAYYSDGRISLGSNCPNRQTY
jgi:hypothetical protein